jgi:hypothetical protein
MFKEKDKLRKTTNTHLGSQSQSLEETVLGDIDITIEETPENIVVERESVDVRCDRRRHRKAC